MRSDHWCARDGDHVIEGFVRDVRNVHHHPQAVHFAHYLASKLRQAVVVFDGRVGLVGLRIRPIVRVHVSERHVAHSEAVEIPQRRQAVLDGMSTFDAHERGDFPLPGNPPDIGGRAGHLERVRITIDLIEHDADHVECPPGSAAAFGRSFVHEAGAHVNREKLRIDSAGFHSAQVRLGLHRSIRIVATVAEQETVIEHGRSDIVVRVDDDGLAMQPFGFGSKRHFVSGFGCRTSTYKGKENCHQRQQSRSAAFEDDEPAERGLWLCRHAI